MLDSDSPVNSSGDQCCCIGISSQYRSLSSYIACKHPKEEDCGISNFITFESEMQEPEVHRPAGSSVCAAGCPLPTSSTLNRSFNLGMTGAIWTANPAPQRPRPRVPQERRPAPSPPCQDLAQGCFRKEGVLTPIPPKDVREGGPALNLRHTPLQDSESLTKDRSRQ